MMDVTSDEGKAALMHLKDTSIMITFTFKGSVHPNRTTSILPPTFSNVHSCRQIQLHVLSFLNIRVLHLHTYNGGDWKQLRKEVKHTFLLYQFSTFVFHF